MVRIQQGIAITRDGIAAPDGTGPICDTILKADDGLALDWIFDRQPVPGAPGLSAFMQPIADLWRELLLRAIFHLAETQAVTLPLLWLYPRNLPALGEISHDTDLSEPELALRLLEALDQAQIHSTWCVILPGYPPEVIAAIRAAGHELAMHYDSFSVDRPWSEANFRGQREALTEMFGGQCADQQQEPLSALGRGQRSVELVRARRHPARSNEGAVQDGRHRVHLRHMPSLLPRRSGRPAAGRARAADPDAGYAVDLADGRAGADARRRAERARRAAPALPPRPHRQAGADRCVPGVGRGRPRRRAGVVDGRRDQRLGAGATAGSLEAFGDGAYALHTGASALPGATLLWLGSADKRATLNGAACEAQTVERWGFRFRSVVLDADSCADYRLEI